MPTGIYTRTKPSWLKGKKRPYSTKSAFSKGHKPWNKGLTKEQLSEKQNKTMFQKGHGFIGGGTPKGIRVSIKSEFKKGHIPWNTGTRGIVKSWNKGMRTTLPIREMDHPQYAEWRKKVFERDKHICQGCGQVGGKLQADHIKPWCEFPKLRYKISNGQTLCKKCHKEKTKNDLSKYWKNQFNISKKRTISTVV